MQIVENRPAGRRERSEVFGGLRLVFDEERRLGRDRETEDLSGRVHERLPDADAGRVHELDRRHPGRDELGKDAGRRVEGGDTASAVAFCCMSGTVRNVASATKASVPSLPMMRWVSIVDGPVEVEGYDVAGVLLDQVDRVRFMAETWRVFGADQVTAPRLRRAI